ncbi:hypothetical protein CORC01_14437 [Colletotrichum orchidophilum]|uniref:Uncharacterized protein n=1 Tax=Colletotrichum orchidophilum TaxID=1209926 RepID=A0A1G4AM67_9PEZI|nr:uncharacterized protein CORC01_14437 [Colletotrichum orchidophilum]OHE90268.1 hypothetical protein CORC01_14437 [Colletotrichum orchidophilum]
MDVHPIHLYRTVRVAVREPDGTLLTTEGKEQQILYIQQDGIFGGTGQVAIHLMQHEMMSIRAEIIRFSAHPVCNYVWSLTTDHFKLRVRFTSPWQPFAQIARVPSPQGSRYRASASFSRSPGEVAVRMGPSGRAVGTATQTLVAGHGSPMTCSVNIDISEDDLIVIFQPDDPTLAPVLSQIFTRPPFGWNTETVQPDPYYTYDSLSMPDQNNMGYAPDAENHSGICFPYCSSVISPFEPGLGRQSCVSDQYQLPYADQYSPASGSTLSIGSEEQNSAQFTTINSAGTHYDAIDDRCIVVKLLP